MRIIKRKCFWMPAVPHLTVVPLQNKEKTTRPVKRECMKVTPQTSRAASNSVILRGRQTKPLGCTETTGTGSEANGCGFVQKYIDPFVKFLAGRVGVSVVAVLIFAGILYTTAGSDPQKVAKTK